MVGIKRIITDDQASARLKRGVAKLHAKIQPENKIVKIKRAPSALLKITGIIPYFL